MNDNINNTINMLGDPNNRTDISFSNFPIDLSDGFAHILLLENYLMSFTMNDITLSTISDMMHNRENILPADHIEYNFGEGTTLSLTFRLDEYKRNYYMFLAWAFSLTRKDFVNQFGEVIKESNTAEDFKIDWISLDIFDNFGKLEILNSLSFFNLYLTSLSKPEVDMNSNNYVFTATFKYEFFQINKEKLKTLKELGFKFEANKFKITGEQ